MSTAVSQQNKGRTKETFLALAGIFLGLIFLEWLSRMLFPVELNMRLVDEKGNKITKNSLPDPKNFVGYHTCFEFTRKVTMKNGYRADDFPLTGRYGVALGDSMTFGGGADDEHAWPAQLGQLLPIPVLNAGKGDTGTFDQYHLLKEKLETGELRPEFVIIGMLLRNSGSLTGGNDLGDNLAYAEADTSTSPESRKEKHNELKDLPKQFRDYLKTNLNLYKILEMLFAKQIRGIYVKPIPASQLDKAYKATEQALLLFDDLLAKYEIPWYVLILPYQPDLGKTQEIAGRLRAIPLKNLRKIIELPAVKNSGEYYWPLEGHPNEKGYALIAETIAKTIGKDF